MANSKLQEFIDHISMFTDRADRVQLLVDLAKKYHEKIPSGVSRPLPEQNRIPGCESEVFCWITKNPDETINFSFIVDNPQGISAMAMAVILQENLSECTPSEISQVNENIVYDIFGKELSMGKSMGLMNMVRYITSSAKSMLAK